MARGDHGWENGPFVPVSACGRVLAARCEPEGVTVGLVVGREAALLVDVGTYPAQGAALLEDARTVAAGLSGAPVRHAVVTHDHYDHWFGLAGMTAGPGTQAGALEAWAHAGLGEPEGASARWLGRVGLERAPRPAQRIPDGGRHRIDLGGLSAVVQHHGPAHTRTDLTVWVPEAGVLFAGDLVEESGPPQHGPESDLAQWVRVLDALLAGPLAPNPHPRDESCDAAPPCASAGAPSQDSSAREGQVPEVRVVPGHGAVVGPDFVRAQREQIASLTDG